MNILMMTNTYLPHVGGVARSVDRFARGYRKLGHRVFIVAPEFEDQDPDETGVARVPAVQHFNGSDFAVVYPLPLFLSGEFDTFEPDLIHSHHPFLLGTSALRTANTRRIPLVFTHHTMYEQYTHYVPVDAPNMGEFVIRMCTDYANRCEAVIAPSESIKAVLESRGVTSPIHVVPTGVDTEEYHRGDAARFRQSHGIPPHAVVLGHVGRLAPEKNLTFLAKAVSAFLAQRKRAHFVIVGSGPSREVMERIFKREGVAERVHWTGKLSGSDLVDAYCAMDLFVFTSKSETQGMVLVEALAAGTPVVALDAPGAREVVRDQLNGRLVAKETVDTYVQALLWYVRKSRTERQRLRERARESAEAFSTDVCVKKALRVYETVLDEFRHSPQYEENEWMGVLHAIQEEWDLWTERFAAAAETLFDAPHTPGRKKK